MEDKTLYKDTEMTKLVISFYKLRCYCFSFTIRLHWMADLIDMPRLFKVAHTTLLCYS